MDFGTNDNGVDVVQSPRDKFLIINVITELFVPMRQLPLKKVQQRFAILSPNTHRKLAGIVSTA